MLFDVLIPNMASIYGASHLTRINTWFVTKNDEYVKADCVFKTVCQGEQKQAPTNQQQSLGKETSGLKSEKDRIRKYLFPRCRKQTQYRGKHWKMDVFVYRALDVFISG